MATILGSRILRGDGTGGVVANATRDPTWGGGSAYVYDIVWDDKTHARKATPSTISRSGWALQPEKVDPSECNRIWADFQTERVRQMSLRHAGVSVGARPHSGTPVRNAAAPADMPAPAVEDSRSGVASRPASWHARQIMAGAFDDVQFAISIDHRKLTIGWVNGPVETRVERALSSLREKGWVDKLIVRRGANKHLIQASIDHVMARVWGDPPGDAAQGDRMRLTPEGFQMRQLASVMTPLSSPLGAYPYGKLIQCVIDRWDDSLGRFLDTERTRYLVQERGLLFPAGDAIESSGFSERLQSVSERNEEAQEQDHGRTDRVRE